MSVALAGEVIHIAGPGRIEDAETLASLLQAAPGRVVDLSMAGPLHTAIWQALMAFRPAVAGPVSDPFTAAWLLPLLSGAAPGALPLPRTTGARI